MSNLAWSEFFIDSLGEGFELIFPSSPRSTNIEKRCSKKIGTEGYIRNIKIGLCDVHDTLEIIITFRFMRTLCEMTKHHFYIIDRTSKFDPVILRDDYGREIECNFIKAEKSEEGEGEGKSMEFFLSFKINKEEYKTKENYFQLVS